jgi:TolB protein
MNSDGTNQHNFTNNQGNGLPYLANSQGQDWYSKWSPDGRYIAFSRGIWSSDTAVWIQRVDGSEVPRPVTPAGFYRNIAWNPDARTLLIAYDVGSKGLLTFDIYASMNQTPTTISGPNGFFDDDPEYSLDGTKILISSNRSGNYEIYMMNSDGTELRQLTDHPAADWRPCWIREYY